MTHDFIKIHFAILDDRQKSVELFDEMFIRSDQIAAVFIARTEDSPFKGLVFIQTGKGDRGPTGIYCQESISEKMDMLSLRPKQDYNSNLNTTF